jgi:hypothetical protein
MGLPASIWPFFKDANNATCTGNLAPKREQNHVERSGTNAGSARHQTFTT